MYCIGVGNGEVCEILEIPKIFVLLVTIIDKSPHTHFLFASDATVLAVPMYGDLINSYEPTDYHPTSLRSKNYLSKFLWIRWSESQ